MSNIRSLVGDARFSAFYDEFTVVTGGNLTQTMSNNQRYGHFMVQNPVAVNDEVSIKFNLSPGSYMLFMLGITNNSYGISTVNIDGVVQGTVDWYSIAQTLNSLKTLPINISGIQTHTLSFKAATRNGLATNFGLALTKVWIK